MEKCYVARPMNTYDMPRLSSALEEYVKGVLFPNIGIVDPGSPNIRFMVKEFDTLLLQHHDRNSVSSMLMTVFKALVNSCECAVGLMFPMYKADARPGAVVDFWAIGAGVAGELITQVNSGKPAYLLSCFPDGIEDIVAYGFCHYEILQGQELTDGLSTSIAVRIPDGNAEYVGEFRILTIDETRARLYSRNPDGSVNRKAFAPFFL